MLDSATIDVIARAYDAAEKGRHRIRPPSVEESGVAAAVLNHPANGVAWLANKLAPFDIALEPGQFILGGSFTGVVEARAGDVFHIDYGPLGTITSRFV
ncbi:MAG: hypothetical protein AB7U95_39475 [Reyranella sp.]